MVVQMKFAYTPVSAELRPRNLNTNFNGPSPLAIPKNTSQFSDAGRLVVEVQHGQMQIADGISDDGEVSDQPIQSSDRQFEL